MTDQNKRKSAKDGGSSSRRITHIGPGNPKGRPKGSRNRKTIIKEFADRTQRVTIDGEMWDVTTVELLLHMARNLALSGDLRAAKKLDKLRQDLSPEPIESDGVLLAPEILPVEEFIRRETIGGSFISGPPSLPPPHDKKSG